MASRIFWVFTAGMALIVGMVLQDGPWFMAWADESEVAERTERAIDRGVDRVVDRSVDRIQVTGTDGREIDISAETKRALGQAIGRLAKAEADLAVLRIGDASSEEIDAANLRRDQARAEVETLKAEIDRQDQASGNALREQIRREVRDDVRETVRDAVRN